MNAPAAGFESERPAAQGGFSLVELMVSTVASLIILIAIGQMYAGSKASYQVTGDLVSVQETSRFGLDTLTRAIMLADHWGGVAATDLSGAPSYSGVSGSSDCDSSWVVDVSQPVFGADGDSTRAGVNGFTDCIPADSYVAESDVLVLRYADSQPVDDSTVSSTSSPNSSDDLFIRSATGERGVLFLGGQNPASATGLPVRNGTDNYRYRVEAYFLRPCSVLDGSGNCTNGIPSLTRLTLDESGGVEQQPLVDGVEQIQYQFGIDTTGSGQASRFLSASSVTDWNDVIAVRIDMLVRSTNPDVAYEDANPSYSLAGGATDNGLVYTVPTDAVHYHRKQLSKIVQIRNRTRF